MSKYTKDISNCVFFKNDLVIFREREFEKIEKQDRLPSDELLMLGMIDVNLFKKRDL